MSLDMLDAAFVRRIAVRARPADRAPTRPPQVVEPRTAPVARAAAADAIRPPVVAGPAAERPPAVAATKAAPPLVAPPEEHDPLVARLLAGTPAEWDALAGHVEEARQRGRRVIAVAGCRAGEGRTTLVRCLATTLRSRGRDVACAVPHDLAAVASGADGRVPTHDKRIILVDAGIWFPPGPVRRAVLRVATLGCEAAILVRRAGAAGGAARQAALEALGIEVLGEVLTFTPPRDESRDGDHAA